MLKSAFTPHHRAFREFLVGLRRAAGMNQRELARHVWRERSFVARLELGERRLDLYEFYVLCRTLGRDPEKTAAEVMRSFREIDRRAGEAVLPRVRKNAGRLAWTGRRRR